MRTDAGAAVVLCAALLFGILPNTLRGQNRYEWSAFSSLKFAQSLTVDDVGMVWVGTTGGVFGYDVANDSFRIFRTTEGLLELNSLSVAYDSTDGSLYVGSDNGAVSVLKKSGEWSYNTDIASAHDRTDRRILGFGFHDGKVYILTAFGAAVFNPSDSTLIEAYVNFRGIPTNTPVYDVLFRNDTIWLATAAGLVYSRMTGTVLTDPNVWSVIPAAAVPAESMTSVIDLDGRITMGTSNGAYQLVEGGQLSRRFDLPDNKVRLIRRGGAVLAIAERSIFRYDTALKAFQQVGVLDESVHDVAPIGDSTLAVALNQSGLGLFASDSLDARVPSSPVSNVFAGLALGWDGSLWVASAEGNVGGYGLSRLVDGEWKEYTYSNTPAIKSNGVWHVSRGADSSIWVGEFPGGFTKFTPTEVVNYDAGNSPMVGIAGNPTFVIGGGAVAQDGRTWMVNWDNTSNAGPLLLAYGDGNGGDGAGFDAYPAIVPNYGTVGRAYRWIVVDGNGTKWLGADGALQSPGLLWFNERESLPSHWGLITTSTASTSNSLPHNSQTALLVDPDGELWVGTPKGLAVLRNPSGVVNNGDNPSFRTIRALTDIGVRAIAVDALNQKWVGTDQGLYVFNSDGSELLQRFTAENSPLVNDQVRAIIADNTSGDVYIGTSNGMSKVSTPAVEPPASTATLSVSPHPFLVPSDEPLRISGLPANATIKILTLSGTLLREFDSPGGAIAFWDGLDRAGDPVPTGIYVIAAGTKLGDETVVGKVAVIRR